MTALTNHIVEWMVAAFGTVLAFMGVRTFKRIDHLYETKAEKKDLDAVISALELHVRDDRIMHLKVLEKLEANSVHLARIEGRLLGSKDIK